jgi:creatinine amidohydrolase
VKLRRLWQEMTTEEFRALDAERVIAILPVAAIEQHGPHLPVEVDTRINAGILSRAVELMPAELPVTILPAMPVGKSSEHTAFPGTLTLTAETTIRLWTEIGESVARAGVKKMVIFNSHGGQPQIADIVARDLRVRLGMFVVTVSSYSLGRPEGMFPEHELKHGIHGGTVETSLMLRLRPDLVQMDKAKNFESLSARMESEYEMLTPEGKVGFGWQTQDLNPDGACGDASAADVGRGSILLDHCAQRLVSLLWEIDRFPLSAIGVKSEPTRRGPIRIVTSN